MFSFLKKKGIDTSNTKDSIKLESLASKPENNKNINMMVSALKNAVDNENNYNIGITGSYGSGKSSIIKSYEKNNNKNLLYISLAILNENDNNDTNNNQDVSERLEKAIVNQIVHQIDPSYIPQSFLKSKKEKNYALNTGFIFIGILLLLLNIPTSYNYIAGIINDDFLLNLIKKIRIYLFAGLIGYGMILLYYIIKKINFSSIIKFKSEIYEFEANSNEKTNDNDSYFDKHLDDILYCISQSKCDAIVFEDIDRFNNQEIFIKLKEINNLLNNRHIFGKSHICKKIPFIYAMNDDLFKSSDKTKFFDVVIPVIPYINGDNSAETFDNLFKNKEQIKPDKVVLNILSHYITDMRLLKNIYNEYIIYIATLSDENFKKYDYNQLFSLIVYKNLYPTDFSNLQFSQGNLYNVINARSKIVKVQRQNLVAQINKIEEEIKKIENEHLKDVAELQALFIIVPQSLHSSKTILLKDYCRTTNIDNMITKNSEYMEREKWLVDGKENKLKELRIQLNDSNNKLNNLSITKLSNIITSEIDIKQFVDVNDDINDNHLQFIRILLVNDFVNEDYKRYLSHFHQGNTSDKDKNFIHSVYAKEQPKYDEELDNIEWIISKINPETLDNNFAVLNYSLLYYLLKNNKNYELNKLYIKILELMENYQDEKKYIFIIGFYKYCLDKELIKKKDLLNDLYKHKPEFVSDIFLYKTSVAADKYAVIYYSIIKNSNIIEIDNIYYNEDESIKKEISEYISTHSDIFINDYIIKDAYCNYLKNFNIKFQNISCIDKKNLEAGILERFLRCIFQEDLYKVNENNINYLVNNYLKLKENEPVQDKSNYEIYLHNLYDKADVLNEFIKFLNLNTDDSIKFEYSKDIEKLIINNEKVSIDDVIIFLEKYDIIIDDISIVRDELWNYLVEHSLIKPIWENIILFYDKFKDKKAEISKVVAVIIEFLLENQMQNKLNTNKNIELFKLILDNIEDDEFVNIIQNFEQRDNIPTDIPISINNMKALLQNKIFAPTKENFDICYNKYRDAFHYFILNNIQLYIENINSYIISKEQLEYIVNVNSIDIDTLFIIVYHYFSNNSYASYRDIKINNTALLEKIFISELDKTIKVIVFKNNIDVITYH